MSVFNGAPHVEQAARSILNQSFKDFEFIIIDDASTDETPLILHKLALQDSRVLILKNEKNIGLTKSLNNALEIAQGDFIARQDADDISLSNRIETQIHFLKQHPRVAVAACSAIIFDDSGDEILPCHSFDDPEIIRNMLHKRNLLIHGSAVFRKKEVLEAGAYRDKFLYAQDYDLWLRVSRMHDIRIIPEYLYKLRISPSTISCRRRAFQNHYALMARKFDREWRKYGKDSYASALALIPRDSIMTEDDSAAAAAVRFHFQKAMYFLGADRLHDMRRELVDCLRIKPFLPWAILYYVISIPGIGCLRLLRRARDIIMRLSG